MAENVGGGQTTTEASDTVKAQEGRAQPGVGSRQGDPETRMTILVAKEMDWFFDSGSGKWYVSYGLPNSQRALVFEAEADQMDALFGVGMRPTGFKRRSLSQITSSSNRIFGGNIAQMEGTGRFEDEVRRVKAIALDQGALPAWADATSDVMDIIFIAQSQGKSQEWVLGEISKTSGFKARFPGLKRFADQANLSIQEAITGFLEYEAGTRAAVKAIGGNPARVTPEVVGGLMNKGYSIQSVSDAMTTFDRMRKFRPAMMSFNQVLKEQGKPPVRSLQEMFDFVAGRAPADVYQVWEASSIAEAATAAGLGDVFSAKDAMDYARATEGHTSLADATGMFQQAATTLLRLRHEVDVEKFGLNTDDIIDLSLGRPPASGVSAAELVDNINRAVLSAQASMRGRAKPFVSFTDEGIPGSQSLSGLRRQQ